MTPDKLDADFVRYALRVFSDPDAYEARVQELEAEGLARSDAQGVADVELVQKGCYPRCSEPRRLLAYLA